MQFRVIHRKDFEVQKAWANTHTHTHTPNASEFCYQICDITGLLQESERALVRKLRQNLKRSRKGFCRNPREFIRTDAGGFFCGFLFCRFPWKSRRKKNPPGQNPHCKDLPLRKGVPGISGQKDSRRSRK